MATPLSPYVNAALSLRRRGTGSNSFNAPYTYGYQGLPPQSPTPESVTIPGASTAPVSSGNPMSGEQISGANLRLADAGPRTVGSRRAGGRSKPGARFAGGEFRGKTLDQARARIYRDQQGGSGGAYGAPFGAGSTAGRSTSALHGRSGLMARKKRTPGQISGAQPVSPANLPASTRSIMNMSLKRVAGMPATKTQQQLLKRSVLHGTGTPGDASANAPTPTTRTPSSTVSNSPSVNSASRKKPFTVGGR